MNADPSTYERAIHRLVTENGELYRKIEQLKRELRDLRAAAKSDLHDGGELRELLYPERGEHVN